MEIHSVSLPQWTRTSMGEPVKGKYGDLLKDSDIYREQVGQDHIIIKKNIEDDPRQCIVGVFDGHGKDGHFASYIVSSLLYQAMISNYSKYLELLNGREETIRQDILEIYENIDKTLKKDYFDIFNESGTTASIILTITDNDNKLYKICSNLGDSPIYSLEESNHLTECSLQHNCDNIEAVNQYLERLNQLDKIPYPIYFSRLNIDPPYWDHGEYDEYGKPAPLKVYDYKNNRAILNRKNYEKISPFYPLGIQSRNYPPTRVTEEGKTIVVEGHEHENWGSTLNGELQLLNVFGDFYKKYHISYVPHVHISEIKKDSILILGSDGLTDIYSTKEWLEFSQGDINKEFLEKKIFEVAKLDDKFEYHIDNKASKYPKWDDVSGIFIKIYKNNNKLE